MQAQKNMNAFAVFMMAALIPANLLHLGWTVWLSMEQIKIGWGGGTDIEMLALVLWMTELICLPVILLGVIYLITGFFRQQKRGLLVTNIVLFIGLLVQIGITNLFVYY